MHGEAQDGGFDVGDLIQIGLQKIKLSVYECFIFAINTTIII
jgi:hypothetical protein